MIYISRNAKDVAVSYFHMERNSTFLFKGTLSDLSKTFRDDYIHFGPFHEHIHSFTQNGNLHHLFFVTYEELSINTFKIVKGISEFLNYQHNDEQLQRIIEHVSFGKMLIKSPSAKKNCLYPNYK